MKSKGLLKFSKGVNKDKGLGDKTKDKTKKLTSFGKKNSLFGNLSKKKNNDDNEEEKIIKPSGSKVFGKVKGL